MPLLVHCTELQPGMRLAEHFVYASRIMLVAGRELSKDDVHLLQVKYPDVTLKVGDPILDSIAPFEDDSHEREVAVTAAGKISRTMAEVQERFNNRADLATIQFGAIKNAVTSVMEYLKCNPVSSALLNRSMDVNTYLADRSGQVFYLCLVLGAAVRDYVVRERLRQTSSTNLPPRLAMDLTPLGLGAMFMDVGMFPLRHLFESNKPLSPEDRQSICDHPIAGADLLPDDLPPGVKMIVRTHHENFDGTGYPSGLPGLQQHVFTRIVRLCDAFEAATAKRVYAAAKSPARVLWEMTAGPLRSHYDPVLTKMFGSLIQPFPIGAKIRLTDDRMAVIVRYNRKMPFHPHVIVAFDEKGERLPRERISSIFALGEEGTVRMKSFGDENLEYINNTPEPLPEVAAPASPDAEGKLAKPAEEAECKSANRLAAMKTLWDANYP